MVTFLKALLIIISLLLILVILVQSKGAGLSATFGGTNEIYRTKRGADKVLHLATIILAVFWALTALLIPLWTKFF
jgi:preprotein translocase subunit SecG